MVIFGRIANGVVVLDGGPVLPEGAAVAVLDIDGDSAQATAKEIDGFAAAVDVTDAEALRVAVDGAAAQLRSRTGTVQAEVEVTDEVMPGVVSLPHGWGHAVADTRMSVATEHPGTNSNVLADDQMFDALSGNAVLNSIPVSLAPA